MAGFFKKLFNRITGRPTEEAAPAPVEPAALPAPQPEADAAAIAEPAAEVVAEQRPAIAEIKAPPPELPAEPAPPPQADVKKKEAKKPEPAPSAAQKAEPAKPALKKVEAKAPEAKKPEAKKPEPKKPEPKKAESKKPEPKKPEPKSPESKKAGLQKPEPRKPEAKTAAPKEPAPKPKAKEQVAKPLVQAPAETVAPEPAPPPVTPAPEAKPEPVPVPVVEQPPPVPVVEQPPPAPLAAEPPVKATAPPPVAVAETRERGGWFSRLKEGLSKSSKSISGSITSIFTKKKLDKETLQDLEDTLIQADLGLPVAERIIKQVSAGRYDKEVEPEEVKQILAAEVAKVLKPVEIPFNFGSEKPFVIMVVGVNGSGKTTTIGKLGAIAANEGFKVMFAAGDTFRAAAIEQLSVWGKRIGAETISRPTGADAAGLAFDALKQAQDDGTDILFIDTAGRLQNKAHLMDELDKVVRVIKKLDAAAPHAVLLVLDATTGQNALSQAEVFTKVAGVTGLIMTKLDGTARGGILVAIAEKFKLPIHAIGVGESIDDLQPFDADGFARAIAGLDEA